MPRALQVPCAGPRRKGLASRENLTCAGERPLAKLKAKDTVCIGDKPKAPRRTAPDAKCVGERKKRALAVSEETACRGVKALEHGAALVEKENAPLVGEKSGAGWLADRLAKGALEVGAHLEAIIQKSPMKAKRAQSRLPQPTVMPQPAKLLQMR